jgi:hypothetical protein
VLLPEFSQLVELGLVFAQFTIIVAHQASLAQLSRPLRPSVAVEQQRICERPGGQAAAQRE